MNAFVLTKRHAPKRKTDMISLLLSRAGLPWLLLLPLWCSAQPAGLTYYVSPAGNDANRGTLTKPFRTLARARDQVRQVSRSMQGDVTVYLREGRYELESPLFFGPQDSGHNGFKVVYRAYGEEKPVVSGGRRITGWTHHENGIYKAGVGKLLFRQLYAGERRMTRARTPNAGQYHRIVFWDPATREIGLDQFDVKRWKKFEQVEMVAQMQWAEAVMRLRWFKPNVQSESWVPANFVRLSVQEPESGFVFTRVHPNRVNGQAYHFENAYEFVDEPGEWYLDAQESTLYFKPFPDMNLARTEITVPVLDTLLRIEGTPERPVQQLQFRGITFAHANWTYPSQHGHVPLQAGQFTYLKEAGGGISYGHPPAAVHLAYARNIGFEGNLFAHLGATGVDIRSGGSQISLVGNVLQDISGNGISVGKFFDGDALAGGFYKDPRDLCKENLIANNIVTRIGMDYYGCAGIVCGYAEGSVIEHNEIFRMPYCGVSVGWGWTKKQNASRDNKVRFNHIHHVMQLVEDGAGIYTLSHQPGSEIHGNWIHDITPSRFIQRPIVRGIYLDEGSGGITIGNNAIEKGPIEEIGFHMVGQIIINDNCCQGYNKDIRGQAGLEPPFRPMRNRVQE
jgi:hypothetical protein